MGWDSKRPSSKYQSWVNHSARSMPIYKVDLWVCRLMTNAFLTRWYKSIRPTVDSFAMLKMDFSRSTVKVPFALTKFQPIFSPSTKGETTQNMPWAYTCLNCRPMRFSLAYLRDCFETSAFPKPPGHWNIAFSLPWNTRNPAIVFWKAECGRVPILPLFNGAMWIHAS